MSLSVVGDEAVNRLLSAPPLLCIAARATRSLLQVRNSYDCNNTAGQQRLRLGRRAVFFFQLASQYFAEWVEG